MTTSEPATSPPCRLIVILAIPEAQVLDVAGPMQTFASAAAFAAVASPAQAGEDGCQQAPNPPYRLLLVSPRGGLVRTSAGMSIETQPLAAVRRAERTAGATLDTLVVAGGPGVHAASGDARLLRWIRQTAQRAHRVCSVCTGAFLLAAAGLLDGRRATTHWQSCAQLQQQYPGVRVEPNPIYVRDGQVWTSAGVTAGIDLSLALVEDDLGRGVALRVARQLVVFLQRPGGQSQFSLLLEAQTAAVPGDDGERWQRLHAWIAENLAADLHVERLAAQVAMSPRHFARWYVARAGVTPARRIEQLRVEAARRELEQTCAGVKQIAVRCGFGDEERMRRAFLRQLGIPPGDYRDRFAPGQHASATPARSVQAN